jgi:hypothetical protein
MFIELLFGGVCQYIPERPGESFVQRARRWTDALASMVSLQPRTEQEWLQAADVTTKQHIALHSLELLRRTGGSPKRQRAHATAFVMQVKAMEDARLRYKRLRGVLGA